jgi:cell division septal protein FtsQ
MEPPVQIEQKETPYKIKQKLLWEKRRFILLVIVFITCVILLYIANTNYDTNFIAPLS